jgi:DNA-directed RNA polymerase specialized sigma24 family protein
VKVPQATQISTNRATAYTTSDDFCRIFSEKMKSLYLLGYLLTGNSEKAEQCFVRGIGDCVTGRPVFKEWAHSWARRTVIKHAIQMMRPAQAKFTSANVASAGIEVEPWLKTMLELETLERFVFVMSVLEGYSYQDCSLLLGCSRQAVLTARTQALARLANAAETRIIEGEESKYSWAFPLAKFHR